MICTSHLITDRIDPSTDAPPPAAIAGGVAGLSCLICTTSHLITERSLLPSYSRRSRTAVTETAGGSFPHRIVLRGTSATFGWYERSNLSVSDIGTTFSGFWSSGGSWLSARMLPPGEVGRIVPFTIVVPVPFAYGAICCSSSACCCCCAYFCAFCWAVQGRKAALVCCCDCW